MVTEAVEGEPAVTGPVPTLTPSSKTVTVPEGSVATGFGEVMDAVTTKEPPAVGVRVEGVSVVAVDPLVTFKLTGEAVEAP
jgi:hypothetical protein